MQAAAVEQRTLIRDHRAQEALAVAVMARQMGKTGQRRQQTLAAAVVELQNTTTHQEQEALALLY